MSKNTKHQSCSLRVDRIIVFSTLTAICGIIIFLGYSQYENYQSKLQFQDAQQIKYLLVIDRCGIAETSFCQGLETYRYSDSNYSLVNMKVHELENIQDSRFYINLNSIYGVELQEWHTQKGST